MKPSELVECDGEQVKVTIDGKTEFASMSISLSTGGRPFLFWSSTSDWKDARPIPLTDEDITDLRREGIRTISSKIRLSTEGGMHRI